MESIVGELIKRGTGSGDGEAACAALRQLRSAMRRSGRSVDSAAKLGLYAALTSAMPRRSDAAAEPWSDTELERLFTLATFAEQRTAAGPGSSLDGSVAGTSDDGCIARSLTQGVANRVCAAATAMSEAGPLEPLSDDAVSSASVALQALFSCLSLACGTRDGHVWLSVVGALERTDVGAALGDVADALRVRMAASNSNSRGTVANPLVAACLAILLRVVSALAHLLPPTTISEVPDDRLATRLGGLIEPLARRFVSVGLAADLAAACRHDGRVSIAACDCLVDMLAVIHASAAGHSGHTASHDIDAASLAQLPTLLWRAACRHLNFTPQGVEIRKSATNACAQEGTALLVACAASVMTLRGSSEELQSAMFDEVFGQGPCAAQAFAAAVGEWHCALASAHAASSTEAPAELSMSLQSSAHGTDGVPGPLCFATFAVPVAGVGKKVEVQARVRPINASWDACAVASASVHQWLGARVPVPADAHDPRRLDGFVGVFAEVAPHTGQVNHSKPVQYTVCSMAPPVSHAGQISSDGDRDHPPKGRALGRSSWLTALPIPANSETSSPWAFDVQLYPPAPHARCDRAPHDFSRAVVAVLATGDVASVHVARGTPGTTAPTTPRGGRFRQGKDASRMNVSSGSVNDTIRPRLSPVPADVMFRRPRDDESVDEGPSEARTPRPFGAASTRACAAAEGNTAASDTSLLQALAQQEEEEEDDVPALHTEPHATRPAGGAVPESAGHSTADAPRAASQSPSPSSAGGEARAAELEAENCRLRVELERVVAQRDAAIASSNAARREIDVVESAVVEPLKAEVSELRRLVSRYHAAVVALSSVVDDCSQDAARSEADAVRVRGDVERLYTTLGIDL